MELLTKPIFWIAIILALLLMAVFIIRLYKRRAEEVQELEKMFIENTTIESNLEGISIEKVRRNAIKRKKTDDTSKERITGDEEDPDKKMRVSIFSKGSTSKSEAILSQVEEIVARSESGSKAYDPRTEVPLEDTQKEDGPREDTSALYKRSLLSIDAIPNKKEE